MPVSIGGEGCWLESKQQKEIKNLRYFIVENAKSARNALKMVDLAAPVQELKLLQLNKYNQEDKNRLLSFLEEGERVGLLSEAGLPCVADPGGAVVRLAAEHGFTIKPLVGPSSLMLALMASGGNGQRFTFRGYLPFSAQERSKALMDMKRALLKDQETQILIETPYRNLALAELLRQSLPGHIMLTLALNLTHGDRERIQTHFLVDWATRYPWPFQGKEPCVFVLST